MYMRYLESTTRIHYELAFASVDSLMGIETSIFPDHRCQLNTASADRLTINAKYRRHSHSPFSLTIKLVHPPVDFFQSVVGFPLVKMVPGWRTSKPLASAASCALYIKAMLCLCLSSSQFMPIH